jgi:DNA/RNA endonuclease YhcR with UshA esterase domain
MSDPIYGPQVKRPMRVRVLQVASLVLAVVGLGLLYLYSVNRDIPTVKVADITPTMNFAYVQISGEVTRDAYVFKSGGVVFNMHDGSGEIAVMGGRAQAEALENAGKLPRRGDQVKVAGSLSVSADQDVKLRMQSADQLVLHRKRKATFVSETSKIHLANITPAQKGDQITVLGKLKEVSVPPPGSKAPYELTLEEDGTELAVIFWDKVFQDLEQKLPTLGKMIRATGRVDVYKETIQLKVWEASDLREVAETEVLKKAVLPSEVADLSADLSAVASAKEEALAKEEGPSGMSRIADITADKKGVVFTIVGTLGEPKSIRGGVIYPITDDSGEMVVLFWDKQVSGEERDALESGIRLRVTAPLEVYKGVLELIPADVGAFRVEAAK